MLSLKIVGERNNCDSSSCTTGNGAIFCFLVYGTSCKQIKNGAFAPLPVGEIIFPQLFCDDNVYADNMYRRLNYVCAIVM